MERGNYDINEIPLVMNIRSHMFEPLAVNNNEENMLTSSDDTEVSTWYNHVNFSIARDFVHESLHAYAYIHGYEYSGLKKK